MFVIVLFRQLRTWISLPRRKSRRRQH